MRINHNIQALNAYRNLNTTTNATSKSLEKLSSGLRINRAADDAAGLAISEKMRSQIRGLEMAERNSLDAISLIQTAEGALSSAHSILQRMRELSVQAANGTLEEDDRQVIQEEIDQLTFEIDRIAETTQFNQKKLFSSQKQAFARIDSNEVAYAGSGAWSGAITARPSEPAKVMIEFASGIGGLASGAVDGQTFEINGKIYEINISGTSVVTPGNIEVKIDSWGGSGVDNTNALMTALEASIDKEDPLFSFSRTAAYDSGGTFIAGKLILSTTQPMSPFDVSEMPGSNENVITSLSGASFKNPSTGSGVSTLTASLISSTIRTTELEFEELPKAGDSLVLDGLTIYFGSGDLAYASGSVTIDVTASGTTVQDLLGEIETNFNTAVSSGAIQSGHSMSIKTNDTLIISTNRTNDGSSNGLEFKLTDKDYESIKKYELSIGFQIGANEGERLDLEFNVMDASSLGIGRTQDRQTATTTGVEAAAGVDVSTASGAEKAITIIDNAIRLVSTERSKLGAMQNRLEHTTNNLQTATENLTASESRIRDLDMAKEMTQFTRNNILNQAGQAMLAQANQLPQGVLQLLQ